MSEIFDGYSHVIFTPIPEVFTPIHEVWLFVCFKFGGYEFAAQSAASANRNSKQYFGSNVCDVLFLLVR